MVLQLGGNTFTGALPLEVGHLINLVGLDVSDNRLSGALPNSLGNCVEMQGLDLMVMPLKVRFLHRCKLFEV